MVDAVTEMDIDAVCAELEALEAPFRRKDGLSRLRAKLTKLREAAPVEPVEDEGPKHTFSDFELLTSDVDRLYCELTTEELLERGRSLASIGEELAVEEDRQKQQKAEMKARTAAIEARRSKLEYAVTRGEEEREVEIRTYIVPTELGQATVFRMDTEEVVRTRPLTQNEKQRSLFDSDGKKKDVMVEHSKTDAEDKKERRGFRLSAAPNLV